MVENARLFKDVEAKRVLLESLATTDPLTNLPDHRGLMNMLDREFERAARYGRPFSIAVIDIDHFKALNDSLGHAAGDEALRQFGEVVRHGLRAIDLTARWGGEEFVAIMPETDEPGAAAAAEYLRAMVAGHSFPVGGGIHLTCSIGVAGHSHEADSRDRLMELADSAMYAAKRLGRNQVRRVGDPAIQALAAMEQLGTRDETALLGTVEALTALVDARDAYTAKHSEEVSRLAMRMALAIGLDGSAAHLVGIAGRLHDIGKVGVPDLILAKTGPLTDVEKRLIREHPVVGAHVVGRVPALRVLAPVIRGHHERWDGKGYPDGLAGEQIPLMARIVAVADAFNAIISKRPYSSSATALTAVTELRRCAGTQFDPTVVDVLEAVISSGGPILTWPVAA